MSLDQWSLEDKVSLVASNLFRDRQPGFDFRTHVSDTSPYGGLRIHLRAETQLSKNWRRATREISYVQMLACDSQRALRDLIAEALEQAYAEMFPAPAFKPKAWRLFGRRAT